jgi:hypothetical protein
MMHFFPNLPLQGNHKCAICKQAMHGPCGIFNGNDSAVTFCNHCYHCNDKQLEDPQVSIGGVIPKTQPFSVEGTQQSTLTSYQDVEVKTVTWDNIIVGDRKSTKTGGGMVKSIMTICGFEAMDFTTEFFHALYAKLKLTGYQNKARSDLLQILALGKIHLDTYSETDASPDGTSSKVQSKTKNCVFRLIIVLFSDKMAPKFISLDEQKDKSILDSGMAGNDEYYWQEVAEEYQLENDS